MKKNYRKITCPGCDGEGVRWKLTDEYEEVNGEMLPPLCSYCRGNGDIIIDENDNIVEEEMDKLD